MTEGGEKCVMHEFLSAALGDFRLGGRELHKRPVVALIEHLKLARGWCGFGVGHRSART
jgi:hypothetical protein